MSFSSSRILHDRKKRGHSDSTIICADHPEICSTTRGTPAFLQLRAAIADGAMHNSGERFNPPKCYPGTRQLILKQLLDWILEHDREAFMRWLHGPAGAGKSAILQEIAEMCAEQYLLIASFFFSRTAALRNDEKRLAATIPTNSRNRYPKPDPTSKRQLNMIQRSSLNLSNPNFSP
ncbi:hypothetical protein NLJ89_g2922 [Agrocybe chaxingu]|uniref:Nephrocystin 3-like N-terminal domain-containing protein n=1 Tax=Agrocybe chaxingu TaxID=84603 RepID=A0A9W8K6K7_9AGAR|nr:hypothetical protein NLJ89_g2922 [Agrocybe chaxingu]